VNDQNLWNNVLSKKMLHQTTCDNDHDRHQLHTVRLVIVLWIAFDGDENHDGAWDATQQEVEEHARTPACIEINAAVLRLFQPKMLFIGEVPGQSFERIISREQFRSRISICGVTSRAFVSICGVTSAFAVSRQHLRCHVSICGVTSRAFVMSRQAR